MKTIVIDGVEYELTPVKKQETSEAIQVNSPVVAPVNIFADYIGVLPSKIDPTSSEELVEDGGNIKVAEGKVSERRERYKQKKLTLNDVRIDPSGGGIRNFEPAAEDRKTTNLIQKKYGYNPWFGEGLEEDF